MASWLASLASVGQELADVADEAGLLALLHRVTLPAFGDLCALYVLDTDGVMRPVLPPASGNATAAERLYAYEAQVEGATEGYAWIALDGQLVTLTEIAPAWLETLAQTPEHLTLLQSVGLSSVALAPLAARDKAIGLLLFGSTGTARQYSSGELAVIQHLATLVASALAARDLERREAAVQRRLDELVLAARELAHLVNNDLTLPVGTVEILLDRPDHSAELREMLAAAASDLSAAERHIRGFHQLARGETTSAPSRGHPPPPPPPPAGPNRA